MHDQKTRKKCKLLLILCNAKQHILYISECMFHLSPAKIIFCFSQFITRATDILTLGRVWTQEHEWVKILDFKYNFVYTGATVYNFSSVYSE